MSPSGSAYLVPGAHAYDQLAVMVALVTPDGACLFANAMLEDMIGASRRALMRSSVLDWLLEPAPLQETLTQVARNEVSSGRFEGRLKRHLLGAEALPVHIIVSQHDDGSTLVLQAIEIEQQTRQDREERVQGLAQANKELVRNLAHEIKNPLGGLRGAAQLLQMELPTPELSEYTKVIIHEADRLQALVDRLLAPHRQAPQVADVNIHEVCERVRSLVLAEYPRGLTVRRDYDASLPEFRGDRAQLIQALLNVVQNAAQALAERIAAGDAHILLRTRVVRQVTIERTRYRLALELQVQDNGPGVPEAIRERIFHPLVSGRDGGTGLGLTLAQSIVQQHHGSIECISSPGQTTFTFLIPLP
jgi:two-component system, NtrC family, nitrogen regulation sensor histidine kinase GlnL